MAIVLAAVIGILCPWAPAFAEWQKDYRQALESLEKEQWLGAARLLRQALAANSRASAELVGKHPYLPHFYLGLALYRMNNCVSAMDEWEESETQGVVQARPHYYQQLREYRSVCEPLVLDPAIAQARKRIDEASGYARLAEQQLDDSEMAGIWRDHPELAESLRTASRRFTEVSTEVDTAVRRRRFSDVFDADRAAEQVKETLKTSVTEAQGYLAQNLEEARRKAAGAKSSTRQQIRRLASRATELIQPLARREVGGDGELARLGLELSELSVAAAELDPAASIEELEASREKLDRVVRRAERALRQKPSEPPPPPLPQPLLNAAKAYFRGDYQNAVELLSPSSFDDDRATAQAYLFRAAARFALYRLEGQSDEVLLGKAEADIRTCLSFDDALAPDKKLFSPRFRRLFEDSAGSD